MPPNLILLPGTLTMPASCNRQNASFPAGFRPVSLIVIFAAFLLVCTLACGVSIKERVVKHENYELSVAKKQSIVLVLFPCFPCDVEHTKREAFFLDSINNQGVTTILMQFNKKLYLTETEKTNLFESLQSIFDTNNISGDNVFLGGFSSGGNIALQIGDFIAGQKSKLQVKGVFAVDSPVDLEQLYYNAQNDITLNADEGAKTEGEFLANLLAREIGTPPANMDQFKEVSPFLASQNFIENLPNHKKYKIRLYTEPSPEWHLKNRKRKYENTNSWMIEKFYETLVSHGNNSCTLIKTVNKGIRYNGDIHPHSWNIVEQKYLLEWMN